MDVLVAKQQAAVERASQRLQGGDSGGGGGSLREATPPPPPPPPPVSVSRSLLLSLSPPRPASVERDAKRRRIEESGGGGVVAASENGSSGAAAAPAVRDSLPSVAAAAAAAAASAAAPAAAPPVAAAHEAAAVRLAATGVRLPDAYLRRLEAAAGVSVVAADQAGACTHLVLPCGALQPTAALLCAVSQAQPPHLVATSFVRALAVAGSGSFALPPAADHVAEAAAEVAEALERRRSHGPVFGSLVFVVTAAAACVDSGGVERVLASGGGTLLSREDPAPEGCIVVSTPADAEECRCLHANAAVVVSPPWVYRAALKQTLPSAIETMAFAVREALPVTTVSAPATPERTNGVKENPHRDTKRRRTHAADSRCQQHV
eukprot:Rhum_TRINITY_DN14518_c5_g1::Rhum_TRINITY_DN14518_c5_g1_i1::g.96181::m.96181